MGNRDQHFHAEEEFHSKDDRKMHRKERKLASNKDRSKYKKTDQDQIKKRAKPIEMSDSLARGRILAITPEGIVVDSDADKIYICSLKGSLKHDKSRMKNLVAVGDFVHFLPQDGNQGVIANVEERHSILSRADNLSRNKEQLIAVNIDQVLITASVVLPPLKPFLIDRYIIAAKKGNMQPIIVLNKIDLFDDPPPIIDAVVLEEEKKLYLEFLQIYKKLDIPFFSVSTITGAGIEDLKAAMEGKASVLSGQSGTGKSSLINAIIGSDLRVGGIVEKTWKGSHTTTTAQLLPIGGHGFCIDTPGIKSFGIWDLEPEDIQDYFSEIATFAGGCKYPDCTHLQEPHCAVKKAVEEGLISSLRFASYSALMASLSSEHKHR